MPPHPWVHSRVARQAAGLCLVVVGLDQATKLAATLAAAGQTSGLVVPVHNPRLSLGLAGAPLPVIALLMAVGILAAGGYSLHAAHRGRLPAWVPGLLIGGASSNLLDRLVVGAVRDFLATPWAVINLADLAVLAAVIGSIPVHLTRRSPADQSSERRCIHDPASSPGNHRHAAGQLARCPDCRDRPPRPLTNTGCG
jgi:lipoprotein signal peptidase